MISSLQKEHKAWLDTMYPNQPQWLPAAGCLEEAGELLHAIIATERNACFGAEARYPADEVERRLTDAIGDCIIYVCSLCNSMDWNFEDLYESAMPVPQAAPMELAIQLVRVAADVATLRWIHHTKLYVGIVKTLAYKLSVDPRTAVRHTWSQVKERKR